MSYLGDTSGFDEVEGSGFDSFYELNSVILFALRKRNGIYQIKVILDYDYTLDGVTTSFVAGQFALNAEGGLLSATSNAWIKPEILTYGVPNNIISELLSDTVGDREATAADVLLTHADVLLTHADVVSARNSAGGAEREALAATSTLDDVRQQVDNARGYEHGAEEARDASATSATSAATKADEAAISATEAISGASLSTQSAATSATNAATSATSAANSATQAANTLATITHPSRNLVHNGKGLITGARSYALRSYAFSRSTWSGAANNEEVFNRWHRSSASNEKYQFIPREDIEGGDYTLRWTGGGNGALDGVPNLVNGSVVNLYPPNGVNGNVKLTLPTTATDISLVEGLGLPITTLLRDDIATCHTFRYDYTGLAGRDSITGLQGFMHTTTECIFQGSLPLGMRSTPRFSYANAYIYGLARSQNVISISSQIRGDFFELIASINANSNFPVGRPAGLYLKSTGSYLYFNSELIS